MAGWYQAILHDRGDILRPEVKDDALRTIRQTHPDPLGTCANRTHAFTIAGADDQKALRGHGHTSSEWAFGHGGAKGQIGWADPATGISLGWVSLVVVLMMAAMWAAVRANAPTGSATPAS